MASGAVTGEEQSSSSPTHTTTSFAPGRGQPPAAIPGCCPAIAFCSARRPASSPCSCPDPQLPTLMFCSNCCTSWVSAGSWLAVPQEAQSSAFSNFSTSGFAAGATSAPAA